MECWLVQHCTAAVEPFIITQFVTAIQRGFRQQFQRPDAPCRNNKPQERPFSARTPDNMEYVRDSMWRSPCRSARQQALALLWNKRSIRQILHKDLHYHPHKIQAAQELSEWDKARRLLFCNEFLELVKNKINIVNTLLMSDEAHFLVSGYVNKQNCHG